MRKDSIDQCWLPMRNRLHTFIFLSIYDPRTQILNSHHAVDGGQHKQGAMENQTYDSAEIMPNLMGDNLPFHASGRRHSSPRNDVPRITACSLLTSKDKLNWTLFSLDEGGTHKVPSHAIPTSVPVGHPLMRCHRPAPSVPFWPRQSENSDRRSFKVTLVWQGMFHGVAGSAWLGHL